MARYCSQCGTLLRMATNGYRSQLRDTSYLAPEFRAQAELALENYASERRDLNCELRNPKGYRSVVLTMLLPLLTMGLYSLYWWWRAGGEIRNFLNGGEPARVRDICLLVLTGGGWRFYMHYNYAARIADMQTRVGLPRQDYLKFLCPLLSFFMLGFLSLGLMQSALNKIWEAKRYGRCY
jgi:hypothetical protein